MKKKKEVFRMCCGCREMKEKKELIRLFADEEGIVRIDPSGKSGGRGVYICRNEECAQRALKTGGISRGLKKTVSTQELENVLRPVIQPAG